MKVTIEPFVTKSTIRNPDGTPRYKETNVSRVRVDGKHAGFVPNGEGAKVALQPGFSKAEADEIGKKVSVLLGRDNVDVLQAPEVPAELFQEPESEDSDFGYDDN
jgi:hypothetical protein